MHTGATDEEGSPASPRPPPSPEEVRIQLARILSSPQFPGGKGRGAIFLTYVVEEALSGRGKRIKGYSVGIEVFGRDLGHTQDDAVVRIEAGRLRHSLERYYSTAGQDDPIRIDIPKGAYIPTFDWIFSPAVPEDKPIETTTRRGGRSILLAAICCTALLAGWMARNISIMSTPPFTVQRNPSYPRGPALVIAPFADVDDSAAAKRYANALTEELLTALPRFKELNVLGKETSESLPNDPNAMQTARALGAKYLLTGGLRIVADKLRVTARLLETATGTVLWSQTYDDGLQNGTHADVVNQLSTAVAQPYGIISQTETASMSTGDLDAYACTLRFYGYRAAPSLEGHTAVKGCLEKAVVQFPSYSTAFAMLSMVYLDETRFWFNHSTTADKKPALEQSLLAARRAVLLDPENVRAQQALMGALFFSHQVADALRVGERAMTINPNDTDLMGEYGSFLGQSGNWKRGAEVLRVALSLNPGAGGYYHGDLGLSEYMQGNYVVASQEIRQADLQKFPLFHAVAAIIFTENGETEDAAREAAKFSEMGAAFLANLDYELAQRIDRPEDRERIRESLIKAGVRIPDAVATK